MNFCPKCGAKAATPDAQFCMSCGFKMPAASESGAAASAASPKAEQQPAASEGASAATAAGQAAPAAGGSTAPAGFTAPAGTPQEAQAAASTPLFRAAVGASASDAQPAAQPAGGQGQSMPSANEGDLLSMIDSQQFTAQQPAQAAVPGAPQQPAAQVDVGAPDTPQPIAQPTAQPPLGQPDVPQPSAEAISQPIDLFGGEALPDETALPTPATSPTQAAPPTAQSAPMGGQSSSSGTAQPSAPSNGHASARPALAQQPQPTPQAAPAQQPPVTAQQPAIQPGASQQLFDTPPSKESLQEFTLFGGEALRQDAPAQSAATPATPSQPAPAQQQPAAPAAQQPGQVYQPAAPGGSSLFETGNVAPQAPQQYNPPATSDDLFSSRQYERPAGAQQQWPAQPMSEREQYDQLAQRYDQPDPAEQQARRGKRAASDKDSAKASQRGKRRNEKEPSEQSAYEEEPTHRGKGARNAPPPVNLPEQPRRRSLGGNILTFVVVVLIFALLSGGTVMVMLYFQNSPSKVVDEFITAIQEGDAEALDAISSKPSGSSKLEKKVRLVGIAASTDEGWEVSQAGWAAFLNAFDKQTAVNVLRAQLLQQANNPDSTVESTYPAITIQSEPFLLFIERYYIDITGVALLAPGASDGSIARLNTVDYAGVSTADGVLYSALMPGRYDCQVAEAGADPASVAVITMEMFEVDSPNVLGGEATSGTATLTVSNCLSDDATLYINDIAVGEKPSGGVVTLPDVSLGSTIRIAATIDGRVLESTVVYNSTETTSLSFGEYTERSDSDSDSSSSEDSAALQTAQALSESDINAILVTVYTSYLTAINDQSVDNMNLVTDTARSRFSERISSTLNKANLFEFSSAAANASTIAPEDANGTPTVKLTGTFKYRYKARDDDAAEWTDAENTQDVELVHSDGQWLVNSMELSGS